jgi:hypothetical protein
MFVRAAPASAPTLPAEKGVGFFLFFSFYILGWFIVFLGSLFLCSVTSIDLSDYSYNSAITFPNDHGFHSFNNAAFSRFLLFSCEGPQPPNSAIFCMSRAHLACRSYVAGARGKLRWFA